MKAKDILRQREELSTKKASGRKGIKEHYSDLAQTIKTRKYLPNRDIDRENGKEITRIFKHTKRGVKQ